MAKSSTLAQSLKAAAGKPAVVAHEPDDAAPLSRARQVVPSVLIGASFAPEVRKALKLMEADSGKNLKQLLGQAINMLAAHYGKPEPFHEDD
jgi:hypothetical protein